MNLSQARIRLLDPLELALRVRGAAQQAIGVTQVEVRVHVVEVVTHGGLEVLLRVGSIAGFEQVASELHARFDQIGSKLDGAGEGLNGRAAQPCSL